MLSVVILRDDAYGITIQEEISERMKRPISRGALHTALTRLEDKGFINSAYGEPTAKRGGRRKRYYQVSRSGIAALQESKSLREEMWELIPNLI